MSDATAKIIDEEVRKFVDEAENKCRKILTDNINELHIVAKGLLEYETLSGNEIKDLIKGIPPVRDDSDDKDLNNDETNPSGSVPNIGSKLNPETQTNI